MEPLSFTNLIMAGLQKMNPYASQIADLFLLTCLVLIVFVIYQRGSRFAYRVPSLLITLGILGAILGVSLGLSAFDVHNVQTSLPLLLNGLKFAALIGIMTMSSAIVAKIINNARRIIPQDKAVSNSVTPAMVYLVLREISDHSSEQKAILSSMADRTREYQYHLQRVLELQQSDLAQQISLLEDIKRSLVGKEESSLISQLQRLHLHLQTELHQVEQVSARRFEDLAGELRTWSEQIVENRLPSLLQTMKESEHTFNDQVNENFKQLNQTTTSLVAWQDDYSGHLVHLNDQFSLSVDSLQQSREALQAIVSHTQAIPVALNQLTEIMRDFQQQVRQSGSELEQVRQLQKDILPALGQHLNQLVQRLREETQGHLELVQTSLETQLDMAESSLETQLTSFSALQEGFAKLESQTLHSVEQWQEHLNQMLTRFSTTLPPVVGHWVTNSPPVSATSVEKSTIVEKPTEVDPKIKNTVVPFNFLVNAPEKISSGLYTLSNDTEPFGPNNDENFWQAQGYSLMEAGDYLEAITYFDKAIELRPQEFALFYNKACCYALAGHADLAAVALRQAILLNPECQEMARTDSDLEEVRQAPKFRHLFRPGENLSGQ